MDGVVSTIVPSSRGFAPPVPRSMIVKPEPVTVLSNQGANVPELFAFIRHRVLTWHILSGARLI